MVDITSTRQATIPPDRTNLGKGVTWKIKLEIVPKHQSRLYLHRTNFNCREWKLYKLNSKQTTTKLPDYNIPCILCAKQGVLVEV